MLFMCITGRLMGLRPEVISCRIHRPSSPLNHVFMLLSCIIAVVHPETAVCMFPLYHPPLIIQSLVASVDVSLLKLSVVGFGVTLSGAS